MGLQLTDRGYGTGPGVQHSGHGTYRPRNGGGADLRATGPIGAPRRDQPPRFRRQRREHGQGRAEVWAGTLLGTARKSRSTI